MKKYKSEKFMLMNPDLVRIIGEEYTYGNSITDIVNTHPELNNNRQRVYDSLDYLGIARRRHVSDWDKSLTDLIREVKDRV